MERLQKIAEMILAEAKAQGADYAHASSARVKNANSMWMADAFH